MCGKNFIKRILTLYRAIFGQLSYKCFGILCFLWLKLSPCFLANGKNAVVSRKKGEGSVIRTRFLSKFAPVSRKEQRNRLHAPYFPPRSHLIIRHCALFGKTESRRSPGLLCFEYMRRGCLASAARSTTLARRSGLIGVPIKRLVISRKRPA